MPPTLGNGKICYIQIPATDIARSVEFYKNIFGWNIRQRNNGEFAFDDSVGQVSGTWVLNRPPSTQPGLLIYVTGQRRRRHDESCNRQRRRDSSTHGR